MLPLNSVFNAAHCCIDFAGANSSQVPDQLLTGHLDNILGDLHAYDPVLGIWMDLSGQLKGPRPPPRCSMGFAAVGGAANEHLYLFGGLGAGGSVPSPR